MGISEMLRNMNDEMVCGIVEKRLDEEIAAYKISPDESKLMKADITSLIDTAIGSGMCLHSICNRVEMFILYALYLKERNYSYGTLHAQYEGMTDSPAFIDDFLGMYYHYSRAYTTRGIIARVKTIKYGRYINMDNEGIHSIESMGQHVSRFEEKCGRKESRIGNLLDELSVITDAFLKAF